MKVDIRPLGWLAVAGFLLHGNWEWLQSPFFRDVTTSLPRIVWFRFHCTIGDVLILLSLAVVVSTLLRSASWLLWPSWGPTILLTGLAVGYTVWSERRNLAAGAWSYSEWMPIVPALEVGLVPLLQWFVLTPLALFLAARLARPSSSSNQLSSARGKSTLFSRWMCW